jgi:hypothetical protein
VTNQGEAQVQAAFFDERKIFSVVKPEVLLLLAAEYAVPLGSLRSVIYPGTEAGAVLLFVWWQYAKTPAAVTSGTVELDIAVFVDLVREGLPE